LEIEQSKAKQKSQLEQREWMESNSREQELTTS